MKLDRRLAQRTRAFTCALVSLALASCAYPSYPTVDAHYQRYKAQVPEGDKVYVCSSYGCRTQTPFRFKAKDIAKLKAMMSPAKTKTANDEREATAETLAWMEKHVGDIIGTSADRPADDLAGNGDPTQMDCVDVATNLTSYLLVLERHKLLRHHTVAPLFIKEDLRRGFSGWPHYAAILNENGNGQRFAVDGWLMASGQPPEIVETERWYIDDADIVVGAAEAGETPSVGATGSINKLPKNNQPAAQTAPSTQGESATQAAKTAKAAPGS